MSTISRLYVDYKSILCRLYVDFMSTLCRLYVDYMSTICLLYVYYMSISACINLEYQHIFIITHIAMSTTTRKRKVIAIVPPTHSEECKRDWIQKRTCGHGVLRCSICCIDYDDDDIRCVHPDKAKQQR